MKSLTAYASEQEPLGFFRIFAQPPGGVRREITLFRDAPVKIGGVSTQDPFTESTGQLAFPQITVFDTPGEGDLDWLVPNCDIDIVFENTGGYDFDWRWEGFIASYDFSLTGAESAFSVDLKGALFGLDDYLAIPQFPNRPIPYEILIAQAFDQDEHPAHLGKFRVLFPEDWDLTVPRFDDPRYLSVLKPWGVGTGKRWTGFTSRSTGSWDVVLSSYVQGLLSVMFWKGGSQWSIRNRGSRRPELFLRRIPDASDDAIIDIYLGAPGVTLDGKRDYTQRAGVIYGTGTDEAGIAYSNVQVSPDGRTTYFKPFAYSPRLWPRKNNPRYDKNDRPKETRISFLSGVDEVAATAIAQSQYQRFAEPGITGSITLTSDPRLANGELMPRLMIKGGQTIRIWGLLGIRNGVLAHITQAQADFDALTMTLTYDTKYRDQLTVEEVQVRNRDALTPLHALQTGKYSNTIQDLILPWSYKAGSGIVPTPAKNFFLEKLAQHPEATFPFEEFTTKYPPKNPSYRNWYIEIGKTDTDNSNNNWSSTKRSVRDKPIPDAAIPIRMSEAGTVRLSQIAAYDADGHVMPVKFHVSVYYGPGLAAHSMPRFPDVRGGPEFPDYLPARKVNGDVIPTTYGHSGGGSQTHPFYKGAWERVSPRGVQYSGDQRLPGEDPIVGWGNYYEPAGYWPGRKSKGADRTGLLSDDAQWSWNLDQYLNTQKIKDNANNDEYAGMLFVMIYCDDQFDESVFFMGRFIRVEAGQSTT